MKKIVLIPVLALAYSQTVIADELNSITVVGAQESYFEDSSSTSMKGEFTDRENPYTTSVTKGALISDLQAQRLEDTYAYTTGVTKSGQNADAIMIRGFQTDLQNIQVNGMSGLISRMGSPSTANVERIEVVKGPASVLYGAMEPGGFVNIQTKLPQSEQKFVFETSLQTYMSNTSSFGKNNGATVSFDSTGPLSDNISYRFIVVGEKIDSYRDNVEFENFYAYPSLAWNISDQTSLLLAVEYGHEDGSADNGLFVANHDISTAAPLNTVYQEKDDYDNDEGTAIDLKIEHFINNDLTYNFSWRSVYHTDERDLYENRTVNQSANVKDTTLTRRNRHQYNARDWHAFDTNLKYTTDIANITHNFVAGLSGTYRKTDYDRIAMGGNVSHNLSIYNPTLGGTAVDTQRNRRKTKYYSAGLYLQDKIDLTDQLTVVGSLRRDRTKISFECVRESCVEDTKRFTTDYVSSLGTIYNINDTVSIYGSYAQSYDQNSAERTDKNGQGLESEKSKQFDIGTKLNISESLNTSLSLYKIKKTNVAEQVSGESYYKLQGEIESKGAEAEVQWLPTKNWQFKSGISYNQTEYVTGDAIGNRPANNPRYSKYLFTRYNIPTKIYDGTLGITGGIVNKSKIYTSSSESNRVELPSYTRYDMGLHYALNNIELSLNVENITDKLYYESGTNDHRILAGEPRKVTFNLKMEF